MEEKVVSTVAANRIESPKQMNVSFGIVISKFGATVTITVSILLQLLVDKLLDTMYIVVVSGLAIGLEQGLHEK